MKECRSAGTPSLIRRLTFTMFGLLMCLLLPTILNLYYTNRILAGYDAMFDSIGTALTVSETVREALPDEVQRVISGEKTFSEGEQVRIAADVRRLLGELHVKSGTAEGRVYITAAEKSVETLDTYLRELELQTANRVPVSITEQTEQNIREVTGLIETMLFRYIRSENTRAVVVNREISLASRKIGLYIIIMLLFCLMLAGDQIATLRSLIGRSILTLQELAGRFASGELNARAETEPVYEMVPLSGSLYSMAERIDGLIRENMEKQETARKMEMRALQAQITPHFLYNTFDTIIWLAQDGEDEDVVRVTSAFSKFCRITLSKGKDFITVAEELQHIRSYFVIQSYRYCDILRYEIREDPGIGDARCLKLVLQPLVENAIYHGIKNTRQGGLITVSAVKEQAGGRIRFTVSDNGAGMAKDKLSRLRESISAETPDDRGGYGLYNVNKRLQIYYGSSDLTVDSEPGEGTEITFTIPEEYI